MEEKLEKKFYIKYSKFAKIYLLYPIFFYFYLQSNEFTSAEITTGSLIGTVISIGFSHIFFETWIKRNWVLTIYDDEVETFNTLGTKNRYSYKDLNPPMTNGYLGLIKISLFSMKSDHKKHMAITDWIEGFDECIELVESKRKIYDTDNQDVSNDNKEISAEEEPDNQTQDNEN